MIHFPNYDYGPFIRIQSLFNFASPYCAFDSYCPNRKYNKKTLLGINYLKGISKIINKDSYILTQIENFFLN